MLSRSNKRLFYLFLLSVLLIKLPPAYLLVRTRLFTTHILAKAIVFFLFIFFYLFAKHKESHQRLMPKILLVFFITQAVSIFTARDLFLYWKDFQNLFAHVMLYAVAAVFASRQDYLKRFSSYSIGVGSLIVLLDFTFYFFTRRFLDLGSYVLQDEIMTAYLFNLRRVRHNLYLLPEIFLPFFIYGYLKTANKEWFKKLVLAVLTFMVVFFSLASNFRHRFVLMVFYLVTMSGIPILKGWEFLPGVSRKTAVFVGLISFSLSLVVVSRTQRYNVIDRLLLQYGADVRTVSARVKNFDRAIDLFDYSPLVGVGLGQYQRDILLSKEDRLASEFFRRSPRDPHNIVAKVMSETGLLGLTALFLLFVYWVRNDLAYLMASDSFDLVTVLIIASWGLGLSSLVTPFTTIFRAGWFWLFRGLLEGAYHHENVQDEP